MTTLISHDAANGLLVYAPLSAPSKHRPQPLLLGALLAWSSLVVTPNVQAIGETTRISVSSHGEQATGGWSTDAAISADGRFVAFLSQASNLVPGDTNGKEDIFLHDRHTHRTTRVSVDSHGNQGNAGLLDLLARQVVISADGRFVAFTSNASNLVPSDTNGVADAFVHDRITHETTRVSVDSAGIQGNGASAPTGISGNGRFVAFNSSASNLVPRDSNGYMDTFVHDRQTHETTRFHAASAFAPDGHESRGGSLSANGRFVAFEAQSGFSYGGVAGRKIYVHDRIKGRTDLVSISSEGQPADRDSHGAAISADGRFVAFTSPAMNLVPGVVNLLNQVFIHDRQLRQTTCVSVDAAGKASNGEAWEIALSADGRFVAFTSRASNLVPGDTNGADGNGNGKDLFIHDRLTHQTTRANVDSAGHEGNQGYDSYFGMPNLSADGRFVVFASDANNLVPHDTNDTYDVFLRDRLLDRSATADVAITQTVSPNPFPASSPITYTLNVVNHGPDAAGEVTLVDSPLRGSAVPSQGTCSNGAPLVCYLGSLAAGASATVTLTLSPRGTGTPRVYNAANVNAAPVDPNPANNKTSLHASVAP